MNIPAEFAIDASGLARRFGASWVLRGATLALPPGEIVGLQGANGSGKTTLLRILATLLRPDAGTARVAGHDIVREPDAVREHIAFLSHVPGLYDDLTARENLQFAAEMRGAQPTATDALLERVNLLHVADVRTRGFSAGMKQRLSLARLLLGRPQVLLLDEPYSNLDAEGVTLMNEVIGEIRELGGAALMALHELVPAATVLDRTLTLAQGRIATEPPASVQ